MENTGGDDETKLVPLLVNTFPDVPAVDGYVAVEYVGSAPELACNTCPVEPTDVLETALLAPPNNTPCCVTVDPVKAVPVNVTMPVELISVELPGVATIFTSSYCPCSNRR